MGHGAGSMGQGEFGSPVVMVKTKIYILTEMLVNKNFPMPYAPCPMP